MTPHIDYDCWVPRFAYLPYAEGHLDSRQELLLRVVYDRNPHAPKGLQVLSDFDWFVSSETDLSHYSGLHIAVFDKQVFGWGNTSIEAYRMAKKRIRDFEPAITYIPEDEDTIF